MNEFQGLKKAALTVMASSEASAELKEVAMKLLISINRIELRLVTPSNNAARGVDTGACPAPNIIVEYDLTLRERLFKAQLELFSKKKEPT